MNVDGLWVKSYNYGGFVTARKGGLINDKETVYGAQFTVI